MSFPSPASEPGRRRAGGPLARLSERLHAIGPQLGQAREVLQFAARRARDVRLGEVAASLTFTTVLSIVPLLAVLLAVFTAFPMFAELRETIEKNVLRAALPEQYAALILRYLNNFAGKAAQLTAAGLVFLVFTAMAMILTVDRVLNEIWQVRQRRPLLQRLLLYWALLTVGPVLLGASVSATSYVLSSAGARQATSLLSDALDYLQLLLTAAALAALYVLVPARRVLWRDALVGGLCAALAGEAMRAGLAAYIRTGTIASIYGAFAVVPLFLLWLYLSWFAVLFGAAIAATLPRLRMTRFADERRAGNDFVTAVALLRLLLEARSRGADGGRLSTEQLARAVRSYPEEAERLLAQLERLDYVSRVLADDGREPRWLLTCDPARATLAPLFARVAVDPRNTLAMKDADLGAWMQRGLAAAWINEPIAALRTPNAAAGSPAPAVPPDAAPAEAQARRTAP